MKNILIFTIGLMACSVFGATPSFEAFRGTNEVLISTNAASNKVVVGPATPISQIASNAANAIVGASNGNYVRIQSGTDNNLWSTNAFYAVGSSNYYQQFKSTTTNTGGILNQVAPFGLIQSSGNQSLGTDPHQDVATSWGYNITGAGAPANTNEVQFLETFESDWQNFNNLIQSEWYYTYTYPYTNFTWRPFSITFQRSTNTTPSQTLAGGAGNATGLFILDNFNFYSPFSAAGGGVSISLSANAGNTNNANATVDVYGILNTRTNPANNGGVTMLGGTLIIKNSANSRSAELTIQDGSVDQSSIELYGTSATLPAFRLNRVASIALGTNTTVNGSGATTNVFEVQTNGSPVFGVRAEGVRIIAGSSAAPCLASVTSTNTGIYFQSSATIIASSGNPNVLFNFDLDGQVKVPSNGEFGFSSGNGASASNGADVRLQRKGPGQTRFLTGNGVSGPTTNASYGFLAAATAHFLEYGYDGALGTYFLRANTNSISATATNQPLAIGIGTNIYEKFNTNGSISYAVPITAPTNAALVTTVAPANLHNVALGKGWTNDLGARADLVMSVKYTDAATGDPALAFTNTVTGEAWTNTFAFGIVGSMQELVTIPDLSTNDYGSFTDRSGTGATVTILNAWWKLK